MRSTVLRIRRGRAAVANVMFGITPRPVNPRHGYAVYQRALSR
jgi:hypothetical protein